jgi:choline dehydrogenase-like flavoprotein
MVEYLERAIEQSRRDDSGKQPGGVCGVPGSSRERRVLEAARVTGERAAFSSTEELHGPPDEVQWDVIIVGSGIGGATVGRSLALEGLSVLFLEKGGEVAASDGPPDSSSPADRIAQGWWPHPVSRKMLDGSHQRFFAAVGCAIGGSSIHYAAALERMDPSDLEVIKTPAGMTPPWPIRYEDLAPYYQAAEALYGIDSASVEAAMQRMSDWDRALMDQMERNGLRPEPLRVAIRYDAQCVECIGKVCLRGCKRDARVACLEEALRQPRCRILDRCDVEALVADERRVFAVQGRCNGRQLTLRSRAVVLAAGAFHSPQILLRSRSDRWPNGLANRSDQVGRNLMFHTCDVIALWAPYRLSRSARQRKSISLRDFYNQDGDRLGYVQSMGLEAGRGEIAVYLKEELRRRGICNELLLSLLVKGPSHIAALWFGGAGIFAAMSEDYANPENRIVLDANEPDGASFTYTIAEDLKRRADRLYEEFSRHVRPWHVWRILPELSMNYGHPCGTCRFGDDPSACVLDRDCRAHDLENLYVVDASFMPRSGAVNPSLTIAANALRVAPRIASQVSALA